MWADIPPVRHRRHKKRVPNELAPIMLERIIAMASNPGQIVVDPFGVQVLHFMQQKNYIVIGLVQKLET